MVFLVVSLTRCSESLEVPPVDAFHSLEVFDSTMVAFMSRHGIESGALGVMRNGDIVFERGFGWQDSLHQVALPPNVMMQRVLPSEAHHCGRHSRVGR